jgi:hypothetical protein
MGSAQRKGMREGQAPQTRKEISSQPPARKEATWSRRKKERRSGMTKRNQHAQSEHFQRIFINVL